MNSDHKPKTGSVSPCSLRLQAS